MPEGANLKFFGALVPASEKHKARYDNEGLYSMFASHSVVWGGNWSSQLTKRQNLKC